jgi:ribulose-phosphate 3-epimerase
MNTTIIPAIIAKSQEKLEELINKVKDFASAFQLDIMDGQFVPNRSIDFAFQLPDTSCKVEAHLMIKSPEEWIQKHAEKVDTILVHVEACNNLQEIIELVKSKQRKFGFVLNPETPVERIRPYLHEMDQVLIMTVNPGFYGSKFLPEALDKIREVRNLVPDMDIEVDGGINNSTIELAAQAGANLFVSGSYIMTSRSPQDAFNTLVYKVG